MCYRAKGERLKKKKRRMIIYRAVCVAQYDDVLFTRNAFHPLVFFFLDFQVPADLWTIYNTREACCATNFPFSDICDPVEPDPPTKYPTIALDDDDHDEIIPLRVKFTGLPDNISISKLKEELESVLKRILLRLAEKVDGLKILSLEERVVSSLRNLHRALSSEEILYYNVHVLRVEGAKFGPKIIVEVRDSYDEILSQIQ